MVKISSLAIGLSVTGLARARISGVISAGPSHGVFSPETIRGGSTQAWIIDASVSVFTPTELFRISACSGSAFLSWTMTTWAELKWNRSYRLGTSTSCRISSVSAAWPSALTTSCGTMTRT